MEDNRSKTIIVAVAAVLTAMLTMLASGGYLLYNDFIAFADYEGEETTWEMETSVPSPVCEPCQPVEEPEWLIATDETEQEEPLVIGYSEGQTMVCQCTYYCACVYCCGKSDGIAANGQPVKVGDVACNWLPFGTILLIDGTRYTVTDRGGELLDIIGHVDIYTPDHQVAKKCGVHYTTLKIEYLPE